MERRLHALFDFQKFQGNKRLTKLIANSEQCTENVLDDDTLSYVAAAGEFELPKDEDTNHDA